MPDHSSEALLLQQLLARVEALVTADADTMDGMLADAFIYTNSSGQVLSKEQYLYTCILSGMMRWISQDYEDVHIHTENGVAVLTAKVHDHFTWEEQSVRTTFRTTQVYILRDGQWLYLAGHTSAPA